LETSLPYSNYVGQFSISAENGWSQGIKPQTDAKPVGQFFPPAGGVEKWLLLIRILAWGIISPASERITHYERSKGMILFWVHSTLLLSWGYAAKEMLAEGGSTANLG
jgi:hypothetical protein